MHVVDIWRREAFDKRVTIREENERVARRDADSEGELAVRCECDRFACAEKTRVPVQVYEAVRGRGNRFLVAPNHENPEVETLVRENHLFTVVQLLAGEASKLGFATDPRSTGNQLAQ